MRPCDETQARRLLSLVAAIREDMEAVAQSVEEVRRSLGVEDTGVRAAACAAHLLRFYSALESVFERVAEEFDGGPPRGSDWHRELLRMMSRAVPEVRPAVLSTEVVTQLDEYRKFRHRMLRAYGSPLVWERMAHLATGVVDVLEALRGEVEHFLQFVRSLAGLEPEAREPQ